jgi:ammonia channel protein AmtB
LASIVGKTLWLEQLKAIGLTLTLAVVGTAVLGAVVKAVIGFRPDAEGEEDGLDQFDHGEAGYHLDEAGSSIAASEVASAAPVGALGMADAVKR